MFCAMYSVVWTWRFDIGFALQDTENSFARAMHKQLAITLDEVDDVSWHLIVQQLIMYD